MGVFAAAMHALPLARTTIASQTPGHRKHESPYSHPTPDVVLRVSRIVAVVGNGGVFHFQVIRGADVLRAGSTATNSEHEYPRALPQQSTLTAEFYPVTRVPAAQTEYLTVNTTDGSYEFDHIDRTSVGLGNVDNTSDANKPISVLQQAALDRKLDLPPGGNTSVESVVVKKGDAETYVAVNDIRIPEGPDLPSVNGAT